MQNCISQSRSTVDLRKASMYILYGAVRPFPSYIHPQLHNDREYISKSSYSGEYVGIL